jgi:hypothetical protein
MDKPEVRKFENPDEVREFPRGIVDIVRIGGSTVGRATLQPGWRWSTSVKPIAQTESCEASHFQYHVSGVLKIRMDDGSELEAHPGDITMIPPGHEAWVVGEEPVVIIDFQGMMDFGKSL